MVTGSRAGRWQTPGRSPSERGRISSVLLVVTIACSWLAGASKAADETKGGENERPRAPCANDRECVDREGYGSVCVDAQCREYEDRIDAFELVGLKEKTEAPPEPFKVLPVVLPAVGYDSTTGFLLGAIGSLGVYLGDPRSTTISSLLASMFYTSKNQFLFQVASTFITADNKWQLQGDWRFLLLNQDTYGLGTGHTPVSSGFTLYGFGTTAAVSGAQPMDMNLIRFRETALRRMSGALYAGLGVSFDRFFGIVDRSLDLQASPPVVTSHYAYSLLERFSTGAYTLSGVSLNVAFDNRDSTINPYRGYYASLSYQWNPMFLGSGKNSSLISGEARAYLALSSAVPRNVIAFWVLAQGVVTGAMPYLTLPSIGWDARNRSGRGYVQGRLRGTAEFYVEAEWRFRITNNGILGGVFFANTETFSRPAVNTPLYSESGEALFQHLKYAGGFGLRVMVNRRSRANMTLDFAWGDKTLGLYFGAGEAF
jgi:hypothetical protein